MKLKPKGRIQGKFNIPLEVVKRLYEICIKAQGDFIKTMEAALEDRKDDRKDDRKEGRDRFRVGS